MVTGGCGFIGSHLTRALVARGAKKVFVVDALRCGSKENLGDFGDKVEVIPFRIGTDAVDRLAKYVSTTDYLFHLAAEKHNQSRDDPRELLRSNTTGMLDLLEAAARAGVKKVVFSSSLYAYGRMKGPPMVETEPASPRTLYGISKLAGENLLEFAARTWRLPSVALRFFFVFGPRQFSGMGYKSVIVKNFERIRAGQNPVIFGDGQQALDYVYVGDAVEAALRAMDSDISGEVLNVGSGNATTIQRLTEMMLAAAGSDLPVRFEPPDWTAGSCRLADIGKIKALLQWSPATSLEGGLKATWEWMTSEASV